MNKTSYHKKYELAISEHLNTRGIMQLLDCGQSRARVVREESIEYCIENGLYYDSRNIPTEAILSVIGRDVEYYYKKLEEEVRMTKLVGL